MSATEEQATSAEQSVRTMEKMREMIHQNASGSVELASSAEKLSSQAERFQHIVGKFTVNGAEKTGINSQTMSEVDSEDTKKNLKLQGVSN
jgi:methyl-accepting chemotaxis protein